MDAPSRKAGAAFIAQVLAPLPEAELADPEMKRLEKRAHNMERQAASARWYTAWMECRMWKHRADALECQRLAHEIGEYPEAPCRKACAEVGNALGKAVDRLMLLPARNRHDLKEKRALAKVGLEVHATEKSRPIDKIDALLARIEADRGAITAKQAREKFRADAIAADEARLGTGRDRRAA